jgi:pimeloyl-ACP methyl ester carboxylesterase
MTLPYSYDQWVKIGEQVRLTDGKVFFVRKGSGPPALMTHSYGSNSWWFSRVVDKLAEQFTVYAIDLPGCAQSEVPSKPYGPPEYANFFEEFMDKMGIAKTHLIGRHGSALTSVHFATTRPERVSKLVLDGIMPWTMEEGKKYWAEWMRPQWLDENEEPKPYEVRVGENNYLHLEEDERREATKRAIDDKKGELGRWWVVTLKEAIKYDVHTRLHLIQTPTLLLYGENEWVRRAEEKMVKGIKGSRVVYVPESGTYPAFEHPQIYSTLVLEFLMGSTAHS